MKSFLRFLAIGSFFATVEEFLTVVVLRHDMASYVFTLLVLFPVFLTFAWLSRRLLIDRLVASARARNLTHYLAFGGVGLAIEWFLIGLSPWSDPRANPFLMLAFQLGMFAFWSTVAFAPWLWTSADPADRATARTALRFYVPYFAGVYLAAFLMPVKARFAIIIIMIIFGYCIMQFFLVRHFVRSYSRPAST